MRLAERIGKKLTQKVVIAFFGGLGMGKTTFTRGLARGLGVTDEVSSPTFALVHEYRGEKTLYHFDMYRVDGWDDLYSTAFFDYLETDAYIAVEWSENVYGALPEDAVMVEISKLSENEREIKIYKKGEIQ